MAETILKQRARYLTEEERENIRNKHGYVRKAQQTPKKDEGGPAHRVVIDEKKIASIILEGLNFKGAKLSTSSEGIDKGKEPIKIYEKLKEEKEKDEVPLLCNSELSSSFDGSESEISDFEEEEDTQPKYDKSVFGE